MNPVAWILALVGGLLAFALAAGSAAGVLRRLDIYSALGVTPLPLIAIFLGAPGFVAAIKDSVPPRDLLVTGGPFLIGCVTLLGILRSLHQQSGGRRNSWR
jgi:hypothetical protein